MACPGGVAATGAWRVFDGRLVALRVGVGVGLMRSGRLAVGGGGLFGEAVGRGVGTAVGVGVAVGLGVPVGFGVLVGLGVGCGVWCGVGCGVVWGVGAGVGFAASAAPSARGVGWAVRTGVGPGGRHGPGGGRAASRRWTTSPTGCDVGRRTGRRLALAGGVGDGAGSGTASRPRRSSSSAVWSARCRGRSRPGSAARCASAVGTTATADGPRVAAAVRSCSSNPPMPSATDANTRLTTPRHEDEADPLAAGHGDMGLPQRGQGRSGCARMVHGDRPEGLRPSGVAEAGRR